MSLNNQYDARDTDLKRAFLKTKSPREVDEENVIRSIKGEELNFVELYAIECERVYALQTEVMQLKKIITALTKAGT